MGNAIVSRQVKNCLNSATKEAAKPVRFNGLNSAGIQVQPRLIEVKYYENKPKDSKYDPQNGVRPPFGVQDGQSISPDEFFVSRTTNGTEEIVRVVAVIGGAGYGKTEMLKKFANDVIRKTIRGLENITVVYFVFFRDLPDSGEMTLEEFLFGKKELSAKQRRSYVNWIKRHSSNVLLVLDGADQYQKFNKLGKRSVLQNHKGKASPVEIINAILSGNLFPGLRILFSSREHAIRHFESEMRPDRTVALIGFSLEDIKKLVLHYGEKRGQDFWCQLTTKAQCLLSVCSIPMFLNFTVVIFLKTNKAPETLTEVLLQTLRELETSNHMKSEKSIQDIIPLLKEMAFNGTNAEKVVFTKHDLPGDLTIDEVQDLMIPYPDRSGPNQRLIDGSFRFIFSHQSLQEALSSLHLNQMPLPEFEEFMEQFHQPQWAIVRRFACGIVVNKTLQNIVNEFDSKDAKRGKNAAEKSNSPVTNITCDNFVNNIVANQLFEPGAQANITNNDCTFTAARVENADSKRQTSPEKKFSANKTSQVARRRSAILKESMTKALERAAGRDLLELLHSLHECGEDMKSILSESMTEIVLGDIIPSPADAYVLGAIAKKCDQIRYVALSTINASQLFGLANAVKEQQLKVKFLDTTIHHQGQKILTLLQSFLECGDFIHHILPSSLTEIALGDIVPSSIDVSTLFSFLKKCGTQIQSVVLDTFDGQQLDALAPVVVEFSSKVKILQETVEIKDHDLLQLFRAFRKCGDNIAPIIRPSVKAVNLDKVELNNFNVHDLVFVLKSCNDLDELFLNFAETTSFETVVNAIRMTNLKIFNFRITFQRGPISAMSHHNVLLSPILPVGVLIYTKFRPSDHERSTIFHGSIFYQVLLSPSTSLSDSHRKVKQSISRLLDFWVRTPLSAVESTVCDLIPYVTDELHLHVADRDYERSCSRIQKTLNSLPKTKLKISIWLRSRRRYVIRWKQRS